MTEYCIPDITDDDLKVRAKHIKPLVLHKGKLRHIKKPKGLRDIAYTWDIKVKGKATGLMKLATIRTLHTYAYYGFFKPTIAEVLAQIPREYLSDAVGFTIKGPDDAADLNREREATNAGFHVAEVTLYREERATDDPDHERFKATDYLVEANSFESLAHWCRWSRVTDWVQDGEGRMIEVGKFKGMPVCIMMFWYTINGKYVGFYDATSMVTHHDMIKDWLKLKFPHLLTRGRWKQCDSMNFGHCMGDVAPDWHKDPANKAIMDEIDQATRGRTGRRR